MNWIQRMMEKVSQAFTPEKKEEQQELEFPTIHSSEGEDIALGDHVTIEEKPKDKKKSKKKKPTKKKKVEKKFQSDHEKI